MSRLEEKKLNSSLKDESSLVVVLPEQMDYEDYWIDDLEKDDWIDNSREDIMVHEGSFRVDSTGRN